MQVLWILAVFALCNLALWGLNPVSPGPGAFQTTRERLELARRYLLEGYDSNASLPSELPPEIGRDGWGREIRLLEISSFQGEVALKAVVSPGPDGELQSSVGPGGEFLPSGDDLWEVLLERDLERTLRSRSLRSIREAEAALESCPQDVFDCIRLCLESESGWDLILCILRCLQQGSEPICRQDGRLCVVQLVQRGCLEGRHGYDGWGTLLWYDSSLGEFFSCGPDRACQTPDDFSD